MTDQGAAARARFTRPTDADLARALDLQEAITGLTPNLVVAVIARALAEERARALGVIP